MNETHQYRSSSIPETPAEPPAAPPIEAYLETGRVERERLQPDERVARSARREFSGLLICTVFFFALYVFSTYVCTWVVINAGDKVAMIVLCQGGIMVTVGSPTPQKKISVSAYGRCQSPDYSQHSGTFWFHRQASMFGNFQHIGMRGLRYPEYSVPATEQTIPLLPAGLLLIIFCAIAHRKARKLTSVR